MQENYRSFIDGERGAELEELIPIVYAELHRQAHNHLRREYSNRTLQTTELINEAYLKLRGQKNLKFESRTHFFAIASNLMRQILVDHARKRHRQKRGGSKSELPLDDALHIEASGSDLNLVELDDALKRLEKMDPKQARIVELRYFGGLSIQETAEIVGVSPATVKREWNTARTWLFSELSL